MAQSQFLKTALRAAQAADEVIAKYYQSEIEVERKADNSPVTIADKEAQAAIIDEIKKDFPDHNFLGEESAALPRTSEYCWVIDPIDGTKNFVRGIPLFSTLIALFHNDECLCGVSNISSFGELLYAEKGGGAFCNDQPIHVSTVAELSQAYLSTGSLKSFVNKSLVDPLLALDAKVETHRGIGDAWSYHLVAQGKMDVMIEAKTNIWDIAPFVCIITEAGGKITDLSGKPVTMTTNSCLATNGRLHDIALATFATATA